MITKFFNRKTELEALEKRYKEKGFQFVPIYGRRRIGKTEIILQFINKKKAIYFLATSGAKKENIEGFKETAKPIIDLSIIRDEWRDIFEYIAKNIKEKIVIVIDEFPYLIETEKGLSSIFQSIIDTTLKNTNIFLIFCGSSLSMMYKEVLTYKAPLYGRRTGQLKIDRLRFKDVLKFFDKPFDEIIKIYSVCGGVPAYLNEFKEKKDFFSLLKEKLLEKDAVLREEVLFLLRQEFREPKVYMTILSAMALGNRNLGKIVAYCGFSSKTGITPYLYSLEYLEYAKKLIPITEKLKSKKSLYFINDNFFDFWFKFIRRNSSLIEKNVELVMEEIKKSFNAHVGFVFEEICEDVLFELNYKMNFNFTKIGKQWGKIPNAPKDKNQYEIDICAIKEESKEILFCECKWKGNVNAEEIVKELNEKAKYVQWNNEKRKESFAVFAKSFSKKIENFEGKKVYCFDLKDIEKVLRNKASY